MSGPLWLLLRLQMGGWLRYLGRNIQTVRGAILALVGLAVFLPWLIALLVSPTQDQGMSADQVARYGPAGLIGYCLLNLVFSAHERAIYFTPAEIQFLFTGPFTRRQILAYKLILTLLVSLPAVLFMSMVFRFRAGWPPAVFLGLIGIFTFMQLFTIALGLVANTLGERLYARGRYGLIAGLVVLVGLGLFQVRGPGQGESPAQLAEVFLDSPAWQTASLPLRAFFEVMLAPGWSFHLLLQVGIALTVLVGLVFLIFGLDAQYLESAAASSARIYTRIQQMRGRQSNVEGSLQPSRPPRWSLPDFPRLGGVGSLAWRQMVSGFRGMGRLVFLLTILGVTFGVTLFGFSGVRRESLLPTLMGLGVWISIFLTTVIPFDFRGDIDRIGVLKTLPIVPWRIALGQLLTPTLILMLVQLVILGGILVAAPDHMWTVLAIALYVPPFCFFLVAIDNLFFLLFPVRLMAATPGDFQAMGRNVLLAVGKMVSLAVVGTLAFLAGMVAWLITQRIEVGVAAAWPIVFLAGALLIPLNALAFTWFDVGRDTPA
ncbi:MAG: putative ABC exporter domain-containing protein [Gemmataceae bacterium]